jgi:type I restriction enzyme M protein
MKTNTNTVVLFLKKRDNNFIFDLQESISNFFINLKDISLNGIESSISKYVSEVWK